MDKRFKHVARRFWGFATRTDVLVSLGTALVSAGFFTAVAQQWRAITGGSWAASIFIGIGFLCLIALVASLALIAWRYFKPLPASQRQSEPTVPNESASQMQDDFRGHAEKLEELQQRISDVNKTMVNIFM